MPRLEKNGPTVFNLKLSANLCYTFATVVFSCIGIGKTEEKVELSALLAETVNYFLEKLQNEQKVLLAEESSNIPQTRGGGYGHGGGYGGHGHGAITLDPVSIISLLALGAFLINNILQLLRANMNNNNNNNNNGGNGGAGNGRSLPESALENLSFLSATMNELNHSPPGAEPGFIDFFKNVGSLYYLQPKKRLMCMKRVVCSYLNVKESREKTPTALKTKIFDFMLSTVTKIVAPEMEQQDKDEKCQKTQKFCSDSLLKDAQVSIEYKVYSQVSSWLAKLAFNGLTSG